MSNLKRYTTIRYYYSNKTKSDYFSTYPSKDLIASLVLTNDNNFYLNLYDKNILLPDFYNSYDVPTGFITQRALKYLIENPNGYILDIDFWNEIQKDIRDFKIKICLNEFNIKWI